MQKASKERHWHFVYAIIAPKDLDGSKDHVSPSQLLSHNQRNQNHRYVSMADEILG